MKQQLITSNLVPINKGLTISDIRNLAMNEPNEFVAKLQKGADDGKFQLDTLKDLKSLYQGLAPIAIPIEVEHHGIRRSVTTSAFPVLTSIAAVAQINQAYAEVESIGGELVTEFDDPKKVTVVAQLHTLDVDKDEVKEREDFPEIGTSEESVEIRHRLNGRKITYTVQSIMENDAQDIVRRTNLIGQIAGERIEEQTLKRITDYDGSASAPLEPFVYRPNGIGTAIFSDSNDTPGPRAPSGTEIQNNALQDQSDLEKSRIRLAEMKNERGQRIGIPMSKVQILVPNGVIGKLLSVLNSENVPGVIGERSSWGPLGRWNIPQNRVHTTSKLDDLSSSAWYYGAFKLQFMRKWKMRMEVVTMGSDTQAYLDSLIAFQARIAWDVEIGANDYVFVIRNLSGVTAPFDE